MITDQIKNAYLYYLLGEKFEIAFKFLENTDLSKIENGKYEINGDKIFAIVQDYTTKAKEVALWEAHRRYIDIQYIVEGEELIGYKNVDDLKINIEYDEPQDVLFLQGEGSFLKIRAGNFAVFMPQDAHMPCISNNKPSFVKKIVIKIEA